ncbi:MAG: hypothetical protein ACTSWY_01710 [Promethearchaeota archaeon]
MVSEFAPWISKIYSPWDLFLIELSYYHFSACIYIFPIISSIIVFILGVILLFYKYFNKVYVSILLFLALSLCTLFLIEIYSESGVLLFNSYGIFVGFLGFGIIFWGLFWMLIQESPESDRAPSDLNDRNNQQVSQP